MYACGSKYLDVYFKSTDKSCQVEDKEVILADQGTEDSATQLVGRDVSQKTAHLMKETRIHVFKQPSGSHTSNDLFYSFIG